MFFIDDAPGQTGAAVIEVHVHHPQDGPVQGAEVQLDTGPTSKPNVTTDAQGIARFEGLAPGGYHINAAKLDTVWRPAFVDAADLSDGGTATVTLTELASGPAETVERSLTVRVTDWEENPISDAIVLISPPPPAPQAASKNTGADGTCSFDGLPEEKYSITATSEGATQTTSVAMDADPQSALVVFDQPQTAECLLSVRVLKEPKGDAATGATVTISPAPAPPNPATVTATEYGASFEGLSLDQYTVTATGEEGTATKVVDVTKDFNTTELVLEASEELSCILQVKVTRAEDGEVIEGATVTIVPAVPGSSVATTDMGGVCLFADVNPEPYEVTAVFEGVKGAARVEIDETDTWRDVTVSLEI
jgi:hypothetical protein